jgi:hypothetical protein
MELNKRRTLWLGVAGTLMTSFACVCDAGANDDVSVEFAVAGIHSLVEAVYSGEFRARETHTETQPDGTKEDFGANIRGVFDRRRRRVRHEYTADFVKIEQESETSESTELDRKVVVAYKKVPDRRLIVIKRGDDIVRWQDGDGGIYFIRQSDLQEPKQRPIDPLALGFCSSNSIMQRWQYEEFKDWLSRHVHEKHVKIEPIGGKYRVIISFAADSFVTHRIEIDPNIGFTPYFETVGIGNDPKKETVDYIGSIVKTKWEQRGEVFVPIVVESDFIIANTLMDRRKIEFEWISINQPISDDEFDESKLGAPDGTIIVDATRTKAADAFEIGSIGEQNVNEIAINVQQNVEKTWFGVSRRKVLIGINITLVLSSACVWIVRRQLAQKKL